ncbi:MULTISPECIES: diaminopimelate epimerase [Lawsonella]|jgi:diaminopimelate epimerase|uniref:Diaminopimelate epimerase n=1 Tax=Lawsonella clevelandensis TaxID=1528099 RepID=A0A2W5IHT7_9ACTN|nr:MULTISPECIES: diaminopimelate epimerase [Lawsonella]PZP89854.1 MAG: diaminopimelate epimerase [Lawsonella clevelandensis]
MFFLKAHGTQNDFIVLPDPECTVRLTASSVAHLCDRRQGIGADGVIRLSRARDLLSAGELMELPEGVDPDEWFMDYRNADGSCAEMCGNGARVCAHVLLTQGLLPEDTTQGAFGTRAGRKKFRVYGLSHDGLIADVEIAMGKVDLRGISSADFAGRHIAGLALSVGNPHLACVLPGLTVEQLASMDFRHAPGIDPEMFPAGTNVEVLTPLVDGHVTMRVYERGVGETKSCGTGTVASAFAALADAGVENGTVSVSVPGGELQVKFTPDNSFLRGPSVIVAEGEYFEPYA